MYQNHLDPAIGCIHGRRITERERCVADRMKWFEWKRRTDQLIEAAGVEFDPPWMGWNAYLRDWAETTPGAWPLEEHPTLTRGAIR